MEASPCEAHGMLDELTVSPKFYLSVLPISPMSSEY